MMLIEYLHEADSGAKRDMHITAFSNAYMYK